MPRNPPPALDLLCDIHLVWEAREAEIFLIRGRVATPRLPGLQPRTPPLEERGRTDKTALYKCVRNQSHPAHFSHATAHRHWHPNNGCHVRPAIHLTPRPLRSAATPNPTGLGPTVTPNGILRFHPPAFEGRRTTRRLIPPPRHERRSGNRRTPRPARKPSPTLPYQPHGGAAHRGRPPVFCPFALFRVGGAQGAKRLPRDRTEPRHHCDEICPTTK